jgi:hypothetical protein
VEVFSKSFSIARRGGISQPLPFSMMTGLIYKCINHIMHKVQIIITYACVNGGEPLTSVIL